MGFKSFVKKTVAAPVQAIVKPVQQIVSKPVEQIKSAGQDVIDIGVKTPRDFVSQVGSNVVGLSRSVGDVTQSLGQFAAQNPQLVAGGALAAYTGNPSLLQGAFVDRNTPSNLSLSDYQPITRGAQPVITAEQDSSSLFFPLLIGSGIFILIMSFKKGRKK